VLINQLLEDGGSTFFIAEIGLNHNGEMSVAKKMISLLKFFETFVLSEKEYLVLKEYAESLNLVFFASVFDDDSLEMMERIGIVIYKLASSELTNLPLIYKVAKTGKPLILSTGMANDIEIGNAIDLFKKNSKSEIVILHCVSLYPIDDENVNIKRISALREKFDISVGFSDHTPDTLAASLAAIEGARIFEKHFTIDRNFDCPDKVVSLTPSEFSEFITNVERAVKMSGNGRIDFGESESVTAKAARRSIFANKDIEIGTVIKESDIKFLRPGVGIPVYESNDVI